VSGLRLHHAGLLVRDADAASARYRRLGFCVRRPTFPALPDAPDRPIGPGNTHLQFHDNFVELVTVAAGAGRDSTIVPLEAPPAALPRLRANVERTAARVAEALARSEARTSWSSSPSTSTSPPPGCNVRACRTPGSTGCRRAAPAWATSSSTTAARPKAGSPWPSRLPAPAAEHPNGARRLVASVLCAPDADLTAYARRYQRYLGVRAVPRGSTLRFALGDGELVIVARSALADVLPGERPPGLPAFVGFGVTVRDQDTTCDLLRGNGVPVRRTPRGDPFVPAAAAHGAAVLFLPPR
jgi:catechol 2,3-dioxygenase-like lactoylglutathione lyase family enzyme